MEIYLVGGAVRDKLLGLEIKERDWVVVGSTPDELISQGYKPVGKDFPIFLHPETKEEYALARTERKTGVGYYGFATNFSPDVTLEQDLLRRDLTINAMAEDKDGNITDPYNGLNDLENKVLKHVSDAFLEDPVRILRIARFAARFKSLEFTIEKSTNKLMEAMVENQEVDNLVPERVWQETSRALKSDSPQEFFKVLKSCGALARIFPEINGLYGVPQPAKHHPEIDCGIHTMLVLEQASLISNNLRVRFAALVHDLGKATTPKHVLPRHIGHEKRGVKIINNMCVRLKIPNNFKKLAVKVSEHHGNCHRAFELRAETIVRLLKQLDAFRNPDDFFDFLLACMADAKGRTGFENTEYKQADYLTSCYNAAKSIKSKSFLEQGLEGKELAEAMYLAQIKAVQAVKDRIKLDAN